MLQKLFYNRKLVVSIFVVLIIASTLVALGPMLYSAYMGRGVATEGVNAQGAKEASTDLNGQWQVVTGNAKNFTSVGFTIDEVLPSERRATSGSTNSVDGTAVVESEKLQEATIVVDMSTLTTDNDVRDNNMKRKLFMTDQYPEATFKVTDAVDLNQVPDDGTVARVPLKGDMTIKGETNPVSGEFDVLRDGKQLIVGGDVPINRQDFGIKSPEFIAAEIADEGTVNVRLTLEKK